MSSHSPKLVTVGVPIYRRLEYIPNILRMIGGQEYPNVELFISDNGPNGTRIREMIEGKYSRPYRLRQNRSTVPLAEHFNQVIAEAKGEYILILNDDDEISDNYISSLVGQMERFPQATVAFGRQETITKDGVVMKSSVDRLPDILSGADFIRKVWDTYEFGFRNVESFLTKTKLLQETGGYPNFARGNHSDDAAVIRVALGHHVVLSDKCVYRHRVHEGGFGWQASLAELAAATRDFLVWLYSDPTLRKFASAQPAEWKSLRELLSVMAWQTYLWRWRDLYRYRESRMEWVRGGFALPFIPGYYRAVAKVLMQVMGGNVRAWLGKDDRLRPDIFHQGRNITIPGAGLGNRESRCGQRSG